MFLAVGIPWYYLNLDKLRPVLTIIPSEPSAMAVLLAVAVQSAALLLLLYVFGVSPAIALCVLVSLGAVGYELLCMLRPECRFIALVLILVLISALRCSYFRRKFPGMDPYYEIPVRLDEVEREVADGHIPPGPNPGLLNDRSILESWAMSLRRGRAEKPRLVLVTVTGGAYRAAFWTTLVLEKLSTIDEAFLTHVRLITGASGGMVGAAYVVCGKTCNDADTSSTSTECLTKQTGCDSLTPVVSQLLRVDLLRGLWPWAYKKDRGVVLEDEWQSLNVTFNSLREKEELGESPSLVISPMIVETGRRLLISNLDLYGLTDSQARSRDGVSREEADGSRENKMTYRRYWRSAVEFFRGFPDCYQTFKVKTAVRIGASFPYISPVVSLPVSPPRRVVDAGYYDNYGVNLAVQWAHLNHNWIRDNTSGLAIIQIRALRRDGTEEPLGREPRRPVRFRDAALASLHLRCVRADDPVPCGSLRVPVEHVLPERRAALPPRSRVQLPKVWLGSGQRLERISILRDVRFREPH